MKFQLLIIFKSNNFCKYYFGLTFITIMFSDPNSRFYLESKSTKDKWLTSHIIALKAFQWKLLQNYCQIYIFILEMNYFILTIELHSFLSRKRSIESILICFQELKFPNKLQLWAKKWKLKSMNDLTLSLD